MASEIDEFIKSCDACTGDNGYPLVLADSQTIHKSTLQGYMDVLKTKRLFETSDATLRICDSHQGGSNRHFKDIKNYEELRELFQAHLINDQPEPLYRHVFLEAKSSRHSLNCSMETFQLLCTYYHVSPEFIDNLFSFRLKLDNRAHNHAYFFGTYSSKEEAPAGGLIRQLDRSGWEFKVGYKLQALEKTSSQHWTLRQTAVYHSFDFQYGKSFWITVKESRLVEDSVWDESQDSPYPKAADPAGKDTAFAASLRDHATVIEGSAQGWRWFIHEKNETLRQLFSKIKPRLTFDEEIHRIKHLIRARIATEQITTLGSNNSSLAPQGLFERAFSAYRRFRDTLKTPSLRAQPAKKQAINELTLDELIRLEQNPQLVQHNTVSFEDLTVEQLSSLYYHSSSLHDYRLAIKLNTQNIQNIRLFYEDIYASSDFPDDIKRSCVGSFQAFQRRTKLTEKLLEAECLRIETLIALIDEYKQLYDRLVQSRDSHLNHRFSQSTHWFAKTANRNAQSMHIISFYTIVFLPGTFLSGLFSTPIFDADGSSPDWTFNTALFLVFLKLCLPLTVVIISGWGLYVRVIDKAGRTRTAEVSPV